MKKVEMRPYKKMLIELRGRLRGDVNALANAALKLGAGTNGEMASTTGDIADMGSDNWEQDNTLLLMGNEEEALKQIEDALERIAEGSYGACVVCEGRIPKMRLNAIPYTPYCVKCASKLHNPD